MNVTNTSAARADAAQGATKAGDKTALAMGQEAFLQLLLAQLRHQDPLKPIESTEYVAQLASLSNLEQAIKQTEKLDSLITGGSLGQAASLIGRTVTSADGSVTGRVATARVTGDGIVAEFADGGTLLVSSGVRISG